MTHRDRKRRQREQRERFAKEQAERERAEGIDPADAPSRWIRAKDAGQPSPFLEPEAGGWRDQPATVAQRGILRSLGLNPLAYRTRGDASDAINRARRRR